MSGLLHGYAYSPSIAFLHTRFDAKRSSMGWLAAHHLTLIQGNQRDTAERRPGLESSCVADIKQSVAMRNVLGP